MNISFIQVWSPAECEPQGDYYRKENPKCYHRTVKSSSPIESWRNNHSFNNDLLLGYCCCLNCLNCIWIWPSIWPNPYFNVFDHHKYKWKWFLKIFRIFLLKLLTIVRFCILPGNLYWFGRPAVHIQLLSQVVWAIPLTISCFSCSMYWPVWRNRWKELPTIPTIVGIQLSSPLQNEMKILAQKFEKIFLGKVHLKTFSADCTTGIW